MKTKSNVLSFLVSCSLLFTLASCGSDSDSGNDAGTATTEEQQTATEQGTYRAVLAPLNTAVAGTTSGTVEIIINEDTFKASSNIVGSPAGVKHLQNVMLASSCPDIASADVNADSFIDVTEILPSTGPLLVPLDSDLSAQLDGMDFGPISNGSGSYTYRRSTTFMDLMADIQAADPDPNDVLVKLSGAESLNLENRVVVIHGVDSSENLPDSVASIGTLSAQHTLPIACGRLVRITQEGSADSAATTGETGATGTLL